MGGGADEGGVEGKEEEGRRGGGRDWIGEAGGRGGGRERVAGGGKRLGLGLSSKAEGGPTVRSIRNQSRRDNFGIIGRNSSHLQDTGRDYPHCRTLLCCLSKGEVVTPLSRRERDSLLERQTSVTPVGREPATREGFFRGSGKKDLALRRGGIALPEEEKRGRQ